MCNAGRWAGCGSCGTTWWRALKSWTRALASGAFWPTRWGWARRCRFVRWMCVESCNFLFDVGMFELAIYSLLFQVVTFTHTVLTRTSISSILVISPVNTIHNWQHEYAKWCAPSLSRCNVQGASGFARQRVCVERDGPHGRGPPKADQPMAHGRRRAHHGLRDVPQADARAPRQAQARNAGQGVFGLRHVRFHTMCNQVNLCHQANFRLILLTGTGRRSCWPRWCRPGQTSLCATRATASRTATPPSPLLSRPCEHSAALSSQGASWS